MSSGRLGFTQQQEDSLIHLCNQQAFVDGGFGGSESGVLSREVFLPNWAFFLVHQMITRTACVIAIRDKALKGGIPFCECV